MKAIVFKEVGFLPTIENVQEYVGECKVKILASSLNHRDIWITKGQYPGLKPNVIMGSDGVGLFNDERFIINPGLDWGENEAYQSKNFRVLGVPDHGVFAEYFFGYKSQLIHCPDHLTDAEAAAIPVAGVTAYRALFVKAQIKRTDKILITGIGGGVAMLAAQLAQAHCENIYFTSGDDVKISRAISQGFKQGFNYKNENHLAEMKETIGGIDVIIDGTSGQLLSEYLQLCNYGARVVIYGGGAGKIPQINPQQLFWKQITIMGTSMGSNKDLTNLIDYISLHKIRPIVDQTFSFNDYAQAFNKMEAGIQFGKLVLLH